MSFTDTLKAVAKAGYYILSRVIFFTGLGLLLNAILIPIMWPEIVAVSSKIGSGPVGGHGGGGMAALILIILYWRSILLFLFFAAGFPVGYFLLGKKHGVTLALSRYLKDKKDAILLYFCERLFAAVKERSDWGQRVTQLGARAGVLEILPTYLQQLSNLPRPMQWLVRGLLQKVKLDGVVDVLLQEGDAGLDISRLSQTAVRKAGDLIDDKLFSPSLRPLFILLAANIGACVAIKFLF